MYTDLMSPDLLAAEIQNARRYDLQREAENARLLSETGYEGGDPADRAGAASGGAASSLATAGNLLLAAKSLAGG